MVVKKIFICLSFFCASLQAMSADAKLKSIESYNKLPYTKEYGKTITKIITNMGTESKKVLIFFKARDMQKWGDEIEFTVHPLRFLGHIFSDPQLKNYMVAVMNDRYKWWAFHGSEKRQGLVKNMNRQMRRNNVFPHLYGFAHAVGADYERVLFYVEREDYKGLVKYLIKH